MAETTAVTAKAAQAGAASPAAAKAAASTDAACVFLDGEYLPAGQARLSVFDAGFGQGIAVFDTLAAWQGYLFKLDAHVERLYRSLHAVRITVPFTTRQFKEIVLETTRRSGLRDAYVQCLVTRGVRTLAPITQWQPSVIVYAVPYLWAVPQDRVAHGARLIIARTRNLPPDCVDPLIKNVNRLHSYLAKLEAEDAGADEVLLLDRHGHVTESRGANVFLVRSGRLMTPASGMLEGITRETVFEIARESGRRVEERAISPAAVYTADEVFLCTTAGGIIPVIDVDGRQIGSGRPGPITRAISATYWRWHVSGPYATPVGIAADGA